MKRVIIIVAALMGLAAQPVAAHTGGVVASGLGAGMLHPLGGLDHILAMIAVGVLAFQSGGRALWGLPVAFVAMMVLGGLMGASGVTMALVEYGIVGSVVLLGVVIAWGRRMPYGMALALVGVLAVFHGHAHGTEMPLNANGFAYAAGFAVATAFLHAVGIGLSAVSRASTQRFAPVLLRSVGAAIAAAGVGLAVAS